MRKTALILLALLMSVLPVSLAACAAAQNTAVLDICQPAGEQPAKESAGDSDIQMSVKEQEVAGDVESVTLTIKNISAKDYTYGAMYALEAEQNGVWSEVTPVSDVMWIEIAYMIAAGQSAESETTLNAVYGTLKSGRYRVAKEFVDFNGNSLTAYGTFTVK